MRRKKWWREDQTGQQRAPVSNYSLHTKHTCSLIIIFILLWTARFVPRKAKQTPAGAGDLSVCFLSCSNKELHLHIFLFLWPVSALRSQTHQRDCQQLSDICQQQQRGPQINNHCRKLSTSVDKETGETGRRHVCAHLSIRLCCCHAPSFSHSASHAWIQDNKVVFSVLFSIIFTLYPGENYSVDSCFKFEAKEG